jgi:hypothetical protein
MRNPADSDFIVEVKSLGTFRFGRRTYGDRLKIRSEFLRLTREFGDIDPDLATHAAIVSAHKVLCVDAPEGWEDLEAIDMIERPDAEDGIFALYFALKAKEDDFRRSTVKGGKASGQSPT